MPRGNNGRPRAGNRTKVTVSYSSEQVEAALDRMAGVEVSPSSLRGSVFDGGLGHGAGGGRRVNRREYDKDR